MCISQAGCNKKTGRCGVTLLEIIVVLVIVAILAGLGWSSWSWRMEQESKKNAAAILKLLWQAEENFFTWKNRYSDQLSDLEIEDPNRTDQFYKYEIDTANGTAFVIKASHRKKGTGFSINETGAIAIF